MKEKLIILKMNKYLSLQKFINIFLKNIYSLTVLQRRCILIFTDLVILYSCFFSTYFLVSDEVIYSRFLHLVVLANSLIGIIIFILLGNYKALTKYVHGKSIYKLGLSNLIITLISFVSFKLIFQIYISFKFLFIFWLLINVLINFKKLIFRDILFQLSRNKLNSKKVLIYGAGAAGAQLSHNLIRSGVYQIKGFIDDNQNLWGRNINGININSPNFLNKINNSIDEILIAMPSINQNRKIEIYESLRKYFLSIKEIPSLEDITSGRAKINELRPINLKDLLGRKSKSDINLPIEKIQDNVICVSGAGGSIGQEICRQIVKLNPKKLILLELSEPSLFQIYSELENVIKEKNFLVPILGNASNKTLVNSIFKQYSVKIVFHAAAYKHVPLVELNPLEGLSNNVFSTQIICECAAELNLDNVVLISSDKAVRPSNIMGCSKRLSELIVQSYASRNYDTIFTMVRFGNVLFSSGSVVPLFLNQIKNGGPITITHSKITRYFMTIPEAVQLVMKTIDLSKGGDIFLLDMGKPVKILDLAKQMIKLSGLKEKSSENKDGNIEIIETGLRPGEKLYEELLIDSESIPTSHPQIYKGNEKFIPFQELNEKLILLKELIKKNNKEEVFKLLQNILPEWERSKITKT